MQAVAPLHQAVHKKGRNLEAHMVCEETQWPGMKTWSEDRESKWNAYHKEDIQWGMGILVVAAKLQARGTASKREPEPEAKSSL